jgi:formate dehydrogenase subunit gamma
MVPPRRSQVSERRIIRFSATERIVHWLVALSFVYVALTGLSMWSPRLFWLSTLFGGGTTASAWHPWGGVFFVTAFLTMFVSWMRQMKLDRDDRKWLARSHRYAVHDHASLPDAGRFNGGQKSLFWIQAAGAVLLLASGLVLWFPESTSRGLREAAILIHPVSAVVSMSGIIIHIYMGTAAVPKALRGMIQGWVTPGWARTHHAKWYRELHK